jgi:hypothetical protein
MPRNNSPVDVWANILGLVTIDDNIFRMRTSRGRARVSSAEALRAMQDARKISYRIIQSADKIIEELSDWHDGPV